MKFNPDLINW